MKDRRLYFAKGLHPIYIPIYNDLCDALSDYWQPICGYRSFAEQAFEYAKGRSTPGPVVTHASAGLSLHNYGLATDWGYFDPDWIALKIEDPRWAEYTSACTALGLRSLVWDKPHNEYSLKKITVHTLLQAHEDFGDKGVQKLLEEERTR